MPPLYCGNNSNSVTVAERRYVEILENGRHVKGVVVSAYVPGGTDIVWGTCLDNCRNLDKFPTSYAETHSVYYSAFRLDEWDDGKAQE